MSYNKDSTNHLLLLLNTRTISLGYKSFEHFDTDKNPSERIPQMAWLDCCVVSHKYLKLKPAAKGKIQIVKEKYWQTELEIGNFTESERGGQYSIFLYFMYTSPAGTYVSKPLPTSDKQAQEFTRDTENGYMGRMVFSASDILVWPAIHDFRQCLQQPNWLVTELLGRF